MVAMIRAIVCTVERSGTARRWSRRRASPRRRRRARRWRRRRPRPGSGREFSIIESSIWVATMTGLACSRHSCTARFCTSGTCSSGISTPRSPRATMSAVERVDDRLERGHRLRLLDLRDDRAVHPHLVHDLVDQLDVVGRAHERQRDHVDPEPQREAQVVGVLLGQRRHAHRDVGQRDALVVGDRAALDHQAADVVAGRRSVTSTATLPSSISSRSPAAPPAGSLRVGAGHPVGGAQRRRRW